MYIGFGRYALLNPVVISFISIFKNKKIKMVSGECVIESQRCDFPFQREDETFYGCAEDENSHRNVFFKSF